MRPPWKEQNEPCKHCVATQSLSQRLHLHELSVSCGAPWWNSRPLTSTHSRDNTGYKHTYTRAHVHVHTYTIYKYVHVQVTHVEHACKLL